MDNWCIILTGANTGIGLECAKELCSSRYEFDLIITVRTHRKGEETISLLKALYPDCKVTFYVMDLADHASIRSFVHDFLASGKSPSILINNAGLAPSFSSAVRGSLPGKSDAEIAMSVNCMGTFLLTTLLIDSLREAYKTVGKSQPSRIVNVSSMLSTRPTNFYIDDIMLQETGHYENGRQAYTCSKIALNLWSSALADKLNSSEITINCVCPGFIPGTGLGRESPFYLRAITTAMSYISSFVSFISTPTQGKDRILQVAIGDLGKDNHGKFISRGNAGDMPCTDTAYKEKILEVCRQYTDL